LSAGLILTPVAPTLLPAQDDDAENLVSFNPFGLSGGANYYFDEALTGFFVGGGPHLAYTAIGDDDVSVSGTMWGLHAHVGHRWIWGNFAFGPMVGLQYSRTTFDFGDVDVPDAVTVDGVSSFFSLGLAYAF